MQKFTRAWLKTRSFNKSFTITRCGTSYSRKSIVIHGQGSMLHIFYFFL